MAPSSHLMTAIVACALCWMPADSVGSEQCGPALGDVFCGLPEVVCAGSTGSIRFNASHFVQHYEEICKTYPHGKYRTADGTCNHLFNLGAANRPPKRLLPNDYDDGLNEPRTRGVDGSELPSATLVSRTLHPSRPRFERFTVLLMQWGQFMDHDITGMPITAEVDHSIRCCGEGGEWIPFRPDRECFPIRMTPEDRRFRGECMEFARSVAARDKFGQKAVPREQINSVTSFIDGSMVYGNSLELQHELRENLQGTPLARMRVFQHSDEDLLPPSPEENCIHREGEFCFLAGDSRVNEQPGLAAIHTLFVRVHNEIVWQLMLVGNLNDEERTFQLARKILVAIIQNVQYSEWLPIVLGEDAMRKYGLQTGLRTQYIPSLDPRVANAFSTAAFRFGHSLIPDAFLIGNQRIPLRELFGRTFPLFDNFTNVLLALANPTQRIGNGGAQARDRFFTEEITGHLFETPNTNRGPSDGLDLVALNIQRGRDHGIPSFNHFRKFCGLPVHRDFDDLPNSVLYRQTYQSVEDIDLFSGLMSEPRDSGLVGETLACLLATQFHDLKFGDRFYFETDRPDEGFTDAQLASIRSITMAHLFCQIQGIEGVQRNLFEVPHPNRNPIVPCSDLRNEFINFQLWENLEMAGHVAIAG